MCDLRRTDTNAQDGPPLAQDVDARYLLRRDDRVAEGQTQHGDAEPDALGGRSQESHVGERLEEDGRLVGTRGLHGLKSAARDMGSVLVRSPGDEVMIPERVIAEFLGTLSDPPYRPRTGQRPRNRQSDPEYGLRHLNSSTRHPTFFDWPQNDNGHTNVH